MNRSFVGLRQTFFNLEFLSRALIIVGTLVLAALVGRTEIAPSRVLILLIGVGLVVILFVSRSFDKALYLGYLFWVASLAVGWRGLWLTTDLRFYAAESIIWLLFLLRLTNDILRRLPLTIQVPWLLLILIIPFGLLGLLTAYSHSTPWDVIWADYKDTLMAIPVFAMTFWLITDLQKWKTAAIVYAITMTGIAALGLVEFTTGSSLNIFGSTDVPISVSTQLGFLRATFSFWGHPSVALLLVLALAFLFPALFTNKRTHNLLVWVGVALLTGGIYASGHRGMWLGTGLLLLIFVALDLRSRWPLLLPYAIGLLFVPSSFYSNLLPVLYGIDQYYDTSIEQRLLLSNYAVSIMRSRPLTGIGWGGAGWVHNDFWQIGATLGLPALFVFVAWYARLAWKLLRVSIHSRLECDPDLRLYAAGLLAALAGLVIMLSTEVILPLAPVAIGFWCFMALTMRFVALASVEEQAQSVLSKSL